MSVDYPVDLPTDAVTTLVRILTGQDERSLPDALHAAWNVQGYLQSIFVPHDGEVAALEALDDVDAVGKLQALVPEDGTAVAEGFFSDRLVELLLNKLMEWIQGWLAGVDIGDLIERIIGAIGSRSESSEA